MIGKIKIFSAMLFLVVLLESSPFVFAQQAQGNVMQCMLIETDFERLECYDRLLGKVSSESPERADAKPISQPIDSSEEAIAEETSSRGDTSLQGSQEADIIETPTLRDRLRLLLGKVSSESPERVDTKPISQPIDSSEGAVAEETSSGGGTSLQGSQEAGIIETPTLRDRFGLNAPAETLDTIDAVVARVQKNISGMSVFFMSDNQVWIQTSVHSQSYPAAPFQVEIRRGSMNSYFLAPVHSGLSVRVRRER